MKLPKIKVEERHGSHPTHALENGGLGVGHLVASKERMQMPSTTACAECPARRDSHPGHLGGYTPDMYLEVLHGPASIACHCSKGFDSGDISQQRHCVGVAAYRANVGHVCQVNGFYTEAQEAVSLVVARHGFEVLDKHFFASPEEFREHHEKGQPPKDGAGEKGDE